MSGTLDASGKGAGETGGTVEVMGDSVTLAAGARIDVSGDAGGGTALVGGNFRGAGPLPNSQTTTVSAGSSIVADAINTGNGGQVAVWSDGVTTFDGSITAKGGALGGNGGYVETSGHTLSIAGASVNVGAANGIAGTWLLDPSLITIDSLLAPIIDLALNLGGDVVLESTSSATSPSGISLLSFLTPAATGSITLTAPLSWNSGAQLSLLASGDINIQASIQNAGNGAVSVVAGWDGTGLLGNVFTALDVLQTPGAFGHLGAGNVIIDANNNASGIAVGSAGGTTTIAAANVTLQGSNSAHGGFAQIGFAGAGATGAVTVATSGDVTLAAGTAGCVASCIGAPFAQIGHGGFQTIGSESGAITVTAGGDVTLTAAGAPNAYAQIGHGGAFANAFASLGAAAVFADNGAIDVTGNVVTLAAGSGSGAYAQIGHGGLDASFGAHAGSLTYSGDIAVMATGALSLVGGGSDAYAQIGNGGAYSDRVAAATIADTGAITVAGTMVALAAGVGADAYAQIGNGGFEAASSSFAASSTFSGDISVTATGTLTLTGAGSNSYAQIGNGGDATNLDALLTGGAITDSGNLIVLIGTSTSSGALFMRGDAFAQIGNGGWTDNDGAVGASGMSASGAITVTINGALGSASLNGGDTGAFAYAQIGNGDAGHASVGDASGDILITVASPIALNSGTAGLAWIGNATGQGVVSGVTSLHDTPPPSPSPSPSPPSPPVLSDAQAAAQMALLTGNTSSSSADTTGLTTAPTGPTNEPASSASGAAPSSTTVGPLEAMTNTQSSPDAGVGNGAAHEGEDLSSGIFSSLAGEPGVPRNGRWSTRCTNTNTFVCEMLPEPRPTDTPQSVQPIELTYSNWGNEAYWQ